MNKIGFSGRFWSILIIAFIAIILIIIGIYYFTDRSTDQIPDNNVLDPKFLTTNYEKYLDKNITVEGYFYEFDSGDGLGYVSSKNVEEPTQQGEFEQGELLLINYTLVDSDKLNEGEHTYYFYGKLKEANFTKYPLDLIYLKLNKVEQI